MTRKELETIKKSSYNFQYVEDQIKDLEAIKKSSYNFQYVENDLTIINN